MELDRWQPLAYPATMRCSGCAMVLTMSLALVASAERAASVASPASSGAVDTTTLAFGLSGKGSGSGRPGRIFAHLSSGTVTVTNSGGSATNIPLAEVLIYGNSTDTDLVIKPAGSAVDVLRFHDSTAGLNDHGRTGTATASGGSGAFHFATGSHQLYAGLHPGLL